MIQNKKKTTIYEARRRKAKTDFVQIAIPTIAILDAIWMYGHRNYLVGALLLVATAVFIKVHKQRDYMLLEVNEKGVGFRLGRNKTWYPWDCFEAVHVDNECLNFHAVTGQVMRYPIILVSPVHQHEAIELVRGYCKMNKIGMTEPTEANTKTRN